MKPSNLQTYLAQALVNAHEEPAFFRALLDASVYVHMPHTVIPGRLRFVQFVRPDNGQTVLPFFSDETRAYVAAGAAVRVEMMTGSELLELTRGATLMLNPNEERCIFYPEEIDALLDHGNVGRFHKEIVEVDDSVVVSAPSASVTPLMQTLTTTLAALPGVSTAYLVEIRRESESFKRPSLLVGIRVIPEQAERAIRAGIAAVQPLLTSLDLPLTFTTFAPSESLPDMFAETPPFYQACQQSGVH
jgi:SseB protein C-terminal domain/SseB protein N-terminal domain